MTLTFHGPKGWIQARAITLWLISRGILALLLLLSRDGAFGTASTGIALGVVVIGLSIGETIRRGEALFAANLGLGKPWLAFHAAGVVFVLEALLWGYRWLSHLFW